MNSVLTVFTVFPPEAIITRWTFTCVDITNPSLTFQWTFCIRSEIYNISIAQKRKDLSFDLVFIFLILNKLNIFVYVYVIRLFFFLKLKFQKQKTSHHLKRQNHLHSNRHLKHGLNLVKWKKLHTFVAIVTPVTIIASDTGSRWSLTHSTLTIQRTC